MYAPSLNFKTCLSRIEVEAMSIFYSTCTALFSVVVTVSTHLCVVCSAVLCSCLKAMSLVGISCSRI